MFSIFGRLLNSLLFCHSCRFKIDPLSLPNPVSLVFKSQLGNTVTKTRGQVNVRFIKISTYVSPIVCVLSVLARLSLRQSIRRFRRAWYERSRSAFFQTNYPFFICRFTGSQNIERRRRRRRLQLFYSNRSRLL